MPNRSSEQRNISLEQKLQRARANRDKWLKVAADPRLSQPAALAAQNLARSWDAATTLYQKASEAKENENDPQEQALLMRALGINPLLPDQENS